MPSNPDSTSMALFCDFENVALGVRDAKYDKFDIKRVLERLLLKGSIVVKKAYCDWDRYKNFKATMHEANFELIEIPHVRQSGKNSADIRLVVDALDLCYTKSHVDTFVIISGDSDFSPLVSKLRENAKQVIGVGVKQSTSDLLIANCDEFIFYDDLVREDQRMAARRAAQAAPPAVRRPADDDARRKEDAEARRAKAINLAIETLEALGFERGDGGKIRASALKDAIKRRRPDFNETYFGFRSFGNLLDEAQNRSLLEVVRDEKGNAYVQRASHAPQRGEHPAPAAVHTPASAPSRREQARPLAPMHDDAAAEPLTASAVNTDMDAEASTPSAAPAPAAPTPSGRGRARGGRKPSQRSSAPAPALAAPGEAPAIDTAPPAPMADEPPPAPSASTPTRSSRGRSRSESAPASDGAPARQGRRPRKPKAAPDTE